MMLVLIAAAWAEEPVAPPDDTEAPDEATEAPDEAADEAPPDEPPAEGAQPAQPVFEPPVLLRQKAPVYPEAARAQGVQGDVLLLLTLTETGTVGEAEVVSAPDEVLGLASLEAARELVFKPATQGGEPVSVQLQYRFSFNLGIADEQGNRVPGSLRGVVADPDGLAIPGARVAVRNLDTGEVHEAEVRPDGSFWASFLGSGRYVVRVEHPAFDAREVEVELKTGETLERAFTLFPISMGELVVTYETRTWREVERAPLEVNQGTVTGSYQLTRRDVEATPGSMEDVSRAIHSLPGIVSDGDMLATFHARGGDTDDVVFMLDRVPLNNPFHLAGFNSMFNPDMISAVDFYAGGPPADVPAATSAVLSVQSWDGKPRQDSDDMDGALDVSASSLRALVMGPVGENTTFALAARRSYLESYFQVMKWANLLDTAFAAPEFSELSGRFAWQPDAQHRVIVTALRTGDSLGIVDSEDDSLINIEGRLELDNNLSMVSLDHKYTPSEDFTVWSTTAWTLDEAYLMRDLGGSFDQNASTNRWFGRTDLYATAARHKLATGVDLSWLLVDTEGTIEDGRASPTWGWEPIGEYDRQTIDLQNTMQYPELAAYVQDTWEGPVRLRAGSRVTYTGATDEVLISPRAGFSVPLPTGTVPKASWGIYQKTPRDPLLLDPELGNPDLDSEQATHWVVGLDQAFPLPGEDAGGLLRVEGYFIELQDLVVNPDNQAAVDAGTTYANLGSGTNKGVDVMLGARAARLQTMVTYSLLYAERTNPLNEVLDQTYAPAQDQRHTLAASGEYQVAPRWRLTARYSFHTGRPVSTVEVVEGQDLVAVSCVNCERLDPTHNLDLRAEWRKAYNNYRLSFYAEVLNATYFHSPFAPIVTVEDGVRTDSMLEHLPARPFLGLRADF